jgi:mono/diheme cytochrome c family protein
MTRRTAWIFLFAMALAPSRSFAQQVAEPGDVTRGRAFAQSHCAACHAIGLEGASPYAPAPPFRTLHLRYPVENLAEALAEGIGVGHRGERQMPEFVLEPEEIDDFLAYLKSLE